MGTDGEGGGKFATAEALAEHVAAMWRGREGAPRLVVCTGGEPLLQLDASLIAALHARGFEIAIESNGTLTAPEGVDLICIIPKADAPVILTAGQELKLVFPRATGFRTVLASAHGRPGPGRQHGRGHRLLPDPPEVAAQRPDPQIHRRKMSAPRGQAASTLRNGGAKLAARSRTDFWLEVPQRL